MTVESMDDKYELLKLVTMNKQQTRRDIYVVGFIQYQLPKWEKVLKVQKKVVYYDKAFDTFMKQSDEKRKNRRLNKLDAHRIRLSIQLDNPIKVGFSDMYNQSTVKPTEDDEFFSPDTKRKVEKLMQIRNDIEEHEILEMGRKQMDNMQRYASDDFNSQREESGLKYQTSFDSSDGIEGSMSFGELREQFIAQNLRKR